MTKAIFRGTRPHTNLKILHQNDKHVISDVKRFAKLEISRSEAPTGHHPVEGVQRGHDPGPEEPAGERHIQENSGKSSICKGSFPRFLGKHHFQAFEFKSLVDCTNLQRSKLVQNCEKSCAESQSVFRQIFLFKTADELGISP